MTDLMYRIIYKIAAIHDTILYHMYMNGKYYTDKQLHFIIMGLAGLVILLIVYPIFKFLSKKSILLVAGIYVFTLMLGLTFAIEIGQWYTGTGRMEIEDITAGMNGFLFMFIAFAVVHGIVVLIKKALTGKDGSER